VPSQETRISVLATAPTYTTVEDNCSSVNLHKEGGGNG
jgi:hypothetical protein